MAGTHWQRFGAKLFGGRLFVALWAIIVVSFGHPSPSRAQTVDDCGGRVVAFDFNDQVDGVPYQSVVSPQVQAAFRKAFCAEITKAEKWFIDQHWLPKVAAQQGLGSYAPQRIFGLLDVDMRISVALEYAISRSLIPASLGRRGAMEFPAREAGPSITAGIMHELAHTYFPNGNRFVDEGFAVYLQNKIGSNPAFPDQSKDLYELMLQLACAIDLKINSNPNPTAKGGLDEISLTALDRVATPVPLQLQRTANVSAADLEKLALPSSTAVPLDKPAYVAFIVAGSFVRFLVDKYGLDAFRELYLLTPLKPLNRDAGAPDRWKSVPGYNKPLGDLEKEWKGQIAASACPAQPATK